MPRALALLLAAYLLIWIPLQFAREFFLTLPSLGWRGAPAIAELAVHAAVAMVCAAAGRMLLVRAPAALGAAAVAVTAGALVSLQSLLWTHLPRNVAPGEAGPLSLVVVAHALFWLAVIRRASRHRAERR
jgi:hypothetical protein